MVIPGDVVEMTEFQEKTMSNSRFILELSFPNVQISLPNKAFYEKLHNRYSNIKYTWHVVFFLFVFFSSFLLNSPYNSSCSAGVLK